MSTTAALKRRMLLLAAAVVAFGFTGPARAGEVKVAVAANFTQAAQDIGTLFEKKTGHKIVFSFGSTGQLYTQIAKGAPFEVFLAADRARPQKAGADGLAMAETRFTYATGKIVLYSRDAGLIEGPRTLKLGAFSKIAIANPVTAPYGAAAVAAVKALGVYDDLKPKIVQGNNIAQTHQFVESGNAELGFVALSQIAGHDKGSRWPVPENLHPVIAQDAILLNSGKDNPAARAFMRFLGGAEANTVKDKFGYGVGEPPKIRPDA
ncbi:molybdate ABC transporter substrate-binding protein [Thalassospiraceae bacterium LMO-SO8]|nr:molybdate ABC transporter substrate-binding protein [Alphaproteobacteria bacterium LMO-S08]WND74579.1 molybdate ABC transporter substrate-binding protein [Thalassospiraceae bacterium LMO-SO8]